ncbi:MAG: methyltransferase domain-containing protein [Sciscionella sp.]
MTSAAIGDTWTSRAAALRDELVAAGKLTAREWQEAVLAVPRHEFVPEFYEHGPAGWELVSAASPETRERWWHGVYTNTSLVTRIGDTSRGGPPTIGPTSSSSAPSLMTRMLEALDLRDGHRVLEIGTGTGYNAALMSHRLGAANVFSVDVNADLVDGARARLAATGYHPTLATTDGVGGLHRYAPYDRIIATCAVSRVPWAWAEQTVYDGHVLVDVKIAESVGNLVLLRRYGDRLEGRFDSGYATFMHMRTPAFSASPRPAATRDRGNATQRTTTNLAERIWENPPLWFLLHLREQGPTRFGYAMDPDTGDPGPLFFVSHDGSWCELVTANDGTRTVWEGGPRPLWRSIEDTTALWHHLGEPGWDRFGLTVHSDEIQHVWLDTPDAPHRWPVVVSRS